MSDEYTPLTHEVRARATLGGAGLVQRQVLGLTIVQAEQIALAEFDRWRDKDRAEAQVEALREVAQDAEWSEVAVPGMTAKDVIKGVRARADRIAREAGIETADAPDCDTHNLVQHRDMKPPWCNKCGRDASGQMQRKEANDD